MTTFILSLYGRYFLQSSLATASPRLDKQFLRDILHYESIDQEIALCVLKSVKRHLWYLSPELIPMALFDPKVPLIEKKSIALALHDKSPPSNYKKGKPTVLYDSVQSANTLDELITEESWFMLDKARLFLNAIKQEDTMGQLTENPELWPELEVFQMLTLWFKEIEVTNDGSERAVKHAQDVAFLFHNEKKRENAFLVKNEHRRIFSKITKKSLNYINTV